MSDQPNADQATFWNELGGVAWAELSPLLDRQIEAVGLQAMAALDPRPGERVLDVGCGGGQTTLALAERVGAGGEVLGLDLSRPLLGIARRRAPSAQAGHVRFVEADAQTFDFAGERFDALFSRFGVMFFADPEAAFRNLLGALKPGGRLAFVCWRSVAENPWMTAPMAAAAPYLPPPPPFEPNAPGPFAFADPDRVRGILSAAGFNEIGIAPLDAEVGGNSVEDSLRLAMRIGPLGARLRENPQLAPSVRDAVLGVVARYERDGAVWMPGAVWIVTAKRP